MKLSLWCYTLDKDKNVVPTKDSNETERILRSQDKIVRQNTIKDKFISTVFLSIDHDHSEKALSYFSQEKPNPNPLVFETMIWDRSIKRWLDYQKRYYTYKESLEGHREVVRMIIKEYRENKNASSE